MMLSEDVLPADKLDHAATLINSGQRLTLPPEVRTALLTAIRTARSRAPQPTNPSAWKWKTGIAAAIVFVIFLFQPWTQYRWAALRDTVPAYESFIRNHPSTDYADSARERIRILREDSVWQATQLSDDIQKLRYYLKVYPDGKYAYDAKLAATTSADNKWQAVSQPYAATEVTRFLKEYPEVNLIKVESAVWNDAKNSDEITRVRAYQKLFPDGKFSKAAAATATKLADAHWLRIASSRSEAVLKRFLVEFPETTRQKDAETQIQALYNDLSWVQQQGTLDAYQRYLRQNPASPERSFVEKKIIDLEVAAIAAGDHGVLPKAQTVSADSRSSSAEVTIENGTSYELTVRYSGPDSQKIVIPASATRSLTLQVGSYTVAASVSAANVRNYVGTDTMQGGRYSSRFYIATSLSPLFGTEFKRGK